MSEFRSFQNEYGLGPVRDYTFLGTEESIETPIVRFDGRIGLWFDPVDHVPWIKNSIEAGCFGVELVEGYLPAVKYTYRNPGSSETCEMTAFAVDRGSLGAIHLYISLIEEADGKQRIARCVRVRDQATVDGASFETELQKLKDHWTRFFDQGASITCDDPTVLSACKASIIRALITFTGRHPHYGVRSYAQTGHDGFPPTIISLVDCLVDWRQTNLARDYLVYYFDRFVTETGRFDYYGPSLAEYGQMLRLVCRLVDTAESPEWLETIRTKLECMCDWLWSEHVTSERGLIVGVPEADTRSQIDLYFHNNAWCWRGLREISSVLNRSDEARCEAYRRAILDAIEEATDQTSDPPFIPPVARRMVAFETMTENNFASYTNYRYWPELLSSGILSREQMEAIVSYRVTHGGEVGGMTRFTKHATDGPPREGADNWPIAEYAAALFNMGKMDTFRHVLFCHLAGHQTPETWTAYEQVSLEGEPYRKSVADYCVPVQLVAPRLLAWMCRTEGGYTASVA